MLNNTIKDVTGVLLFMGFHSTQRIISFLDSPPSLTPRFHLLLFLLEHTPTMTISWGKSWKLQNKSPLKSHVILHSAVRHSCDLTLVWILFRAQKLTAMFHMMLILGFYENFLKILGKTWLFPRICLLSEQRRPWILFLRGIWAWLMKLE